MDFGRMLAVQWRGLSVAWRPLLLHVGVYAGLCLLLSVCFASASVADYLNRMLLVTAVASVMIQVGGFVARLLWLGVVIGEAGWLVSRCTSLVLPQVPTSLVQMLYAGLLLALFLLLARSGGDGGIRTLTPDRPLSPAPNPVGAGR